MAVRAGGLTPSDVEPRAVGGGPERRTVRLEVRTERGFLSFVTTPKLPRGVWTTRATIGTVKPRHRVVAAPTAGAGPIPNIHDDVGRHTVVDVAALRVMTTDTTTDEIDRFSEAVDPPVARRLDHSRDDAVVSQEWHDGEQETPTRGERRLERTSGIADQQRRRSSATSAATATTVVRSRPRPIERPQQVPARESLYER